MSLNALMSAIPLAAAAGYFMGKSQKKQEPIAMAAYSGEPLQSVTQGAARKSMSLKSENAGLIIDHGTEQTMDELCATSIRFLAVDGENKANSGHPGAPRGQALWPTFSSTRP